MSRSNVEKPSADTSAADQKNLVQDRPAGLSGKGRRLLAEGLARLGGMLCRVSYDLDPSVYGDPGDDGMVSLSASELDDVLYEGGRHAYREGREDARLL